MAVPIKDEELLELAGEDSLHAIKDLTLRSRGITKFSSYAPRLPNLQVLSLSHNKLASLAGFQHLTCLVSLNINGNAISSLEGLQTCLSLQQLYASSNHVRDLMPISELTLLTTISMFGNAVASLDDSVCVLAGLPQLKELELAGNPCASVPDYKVRLVQELLCLQSLDGERLLEADFQAANRAMPSRPATARPITRGGISRPGSSGSGGGGQQADVLVVEHARPGTSGGRPPLPLPPGIPGHRGSVDASDAMGCTNDEEFDLASTEDPTEMRRPGSRGAADGDQMASSSYRPCTSMRPGTSSMRPGSASRPSTANCQLVSNDVLNDHPILLEYLAKHVLTEGMLLAQQASQGGGRFRTSFVNRLRETASVMGATESLDPTAIASKKDELLPPSRAATIPKTTKAAAIESLIMEATPHETIRQLVKLCEVLIKEVETARMNGSSRPGSTGAAGGSPARPSSSSERGAVPNGGNEGANTSDKGGRAQPASISTPQLLASSSSRAVELAELAHLRDEVEKLRRENKQLKAENQNIYWLAEDYKKMRGERDALRSSTSDSQSLRR